MVAKLRVAVLVATALLLTVSDGFCWSLAKGPEVFPESRPMYTGYGDRPPNVGYFLNSANNIPDDYVYRTWWVGPRPGDCGSWWQSFFWPDSARQQTAARQALAGIAGAALRQQVHELASQLLASAEDDLADGPVVTVSSFVNLNALYATSTLGRFLGEEMIAALQRAGMKVIEVRKTPTILISEANGEFGLSRDLGELEYSRPAQFMVVGTYTYAREQIFIYARLVRNSDSMIIASASQVFGMDRMVREMLADEGTSVPTREKTVQVKAFNEP